MTLFEREEYKHLDRDTAEVIAIFTDNTKMLEVLEENETEGEYNMCQALDELVADGKAEGRTGHECAIDFQGGTGRDHGKVISER